MTPIPIPNAVSKYVIPVVGIAALGAVAYVGFQYLKKDEIPKVQKNPNYPSSQLSSVEATAIAERLYTAMATLGRPNDQEKTIIFNSLQNLNQNDFVKVYEAFGARQYSKFWRNIGDPFTSDDHSLLTWLSNELTAEDFAKISQIIPEAQRYQNAA